MLASVLTTLINSPFELRKTLIEDATYFEFSIFFNLSSAGLTKSKGEARRMITQGAVRLDGDKVTDVNLIIRKDSETVIKVGKRRFIKIK